MNHTEEIMNTEESVTVAAGKIDLIGDTTAIVKREVAEETGEYMMSGEIRHHHGNKIRSQKKIHTDTMMMNLM